MRVRIGHWPCKQRLCIEFLESDARELITSFGSAYTLSLQDRMIIVEPAYSSGSQLTACPRLKTGFTHWISRLNFAAPEIPAFELMDAELDYQDEFLALELPADHELPWPSRRTLNAMSSSKVKDFCEEAIQARMNSAVASAAKAPSVPGYLLKHAEPNATFRCHKLARQLAGQI